MQNKINTVIKLSLFILVMFNFSFGQAATVDKKLVDVVAGKHRTPTYTERDKYRHPIETLSFFGIKDTMTVVEISPGGGWYTEILAPYLKDNGKYIAAGYDVNSESEYYRRSATRFHKKLSDKPEVYGKVQHGIMQPPEQLDFAKPESADLILSFRNTHNWHQRGYSEAVYKAIFKALKPGGTFGLVQHRAGKATPDTSGKMGYLNQSEVITLAEKVGFKLVDQSEINANVKDTKDYANGVWTLPPSLNGKDKEKYLEIGESDRMTLKFIKPLKK
ncbi:class I SAM-dependent methyltransferase [Aliikangiella maris]|uniref:Methyltransferase n=2 Tax=Aliikangiella maris TaxID=3162458 RepID=A0ABV3MPF0_9GAMM